MRRGSLAARHLSRKQETAQVVRGFESLPLRQSIWNGRKACLMVRQQVASLPRRETVVGVRVPGLPPQRRTATSLSGQSTCPESRRAREVPRVRVPPSPPGIDEGGHWCMGEHGSLIHSRAGFNSPVPYHSSRRGSVAKLVRHRAFNPEMWRFESSPAHQDDEGSEA